MADTDLIQRMTEKMQAASAKVVEVKDLSAAYAYAVSVCEEKAPYQPQTPETRAADAPKLFMAPGLSDKELKGLEKQLQGKNITLLKEGMRQHLGGIDVALTIGQYGIAATGTCVLESSDEELRLATMIAETHVMVLKKSTLVARSQDLADILTKWQQEARYVAFISGASRTADIERVLAIGVHGPLEFHLVLVED